MAVARTASPASNSGQSLMPLLVVMRMGLDRTNS